MCQCDKTKGTNSGYLKNCEMSGEHVMPFYYNNRVLLSMLQILLLLLTDKKNEILLEVSVKIKRLNDMSQHPSSSYNV